MPKQITYIIYILLTGLLLIEVILRLGLINFQDFKIPVYIEPHSLFKSDSKLGWDNSPGTYSIYVNDTSTRFNANVSHDGNRLTTFAAKKRSECNQSIHIYGCSVTFGFSISDSSTQSSQLQKAFPNSCVTNKGVPGYGVAQMFLNLKKSVIDGNAPDIAVFNYINFHDNRTPLSKLWSNEIWSIIDNGNTQKYESAHMPYFNLINDSLVFDSKPMHEIAYRWPLQKWLKVVHVVNYIWYEKNDQKNRDFYHQISKATAFKIMEFCHSNNITPVFAELPYYNFSGISDIISELAKANYYTLPYTLDYSNPKYNSMPYDNHPNAKAHLIYAKELAKFLIDNELMSS